MALTGRIVASVYRIGSYDIPNALPGRSNSLPSAGCTIFATAPGVTSNGVTMNSVIRLLPTGLNVNPTDYYTDSTVTQLNTNGS